MLPTDGLTDDGIDASTIGVVEETHFKHPVREEVFLAPLILIKEHESLPIGFLGQRAACL